MPMPVKATKAQLREEIKRLEGIIEKQDKEWNELVEEHEKLKNSTPKASAGSEQEEYTQGVQEYVERIAVLVEDNNKLLLEIDTLKSQQNKEKSTITPVLDTTIPVDVKQNKRDENESFQGLVTKLTFIKDEDNKRVSGRAVRSDYLGETFLSIGDAAKYVGLKYTDQIRAVLGGKGKSAGQVLDENGMNVRITDWRDATDEEINTRKLEIISRLLDTL